MDYSKLKVFVIEDDVAMRSYLRRVLESAFGLRVYEFGSPVTAFKSMGGTIPDLIILDMHTPHMSGYAAMKLINSNEKLRNIPVFACTADSSPKLIIDLAKLGIKEYILKPFDVQHLSDRLKFYFDEIIPKKFAIQAIAETAATHDISDSSINIELTSFDLEINDNEINPDDV